MPHTLGEAVDAFAESRMLREAFGADVTEHLVHFARAELAAYNRTLTGMKTEYYGDRLRVNGFVSETDQFFQRDAKRISNGLFFAVDVTHLATADHFVGKRILQRLRSAIDKHLLELRLPRRKGVYGGG